MNCTKIEKLIPLYAGGDLSGQESAHVARHLSACGHCRTLAEEFEASRERLSSFPVPEFGAEYYDEMRRAVMQEINSRPPARPSMFAAWRDMFAARPALTASLATIALFCALSFVLYRSLVKDAPRLAALDESMANLNLEMPSVNEARPVIDEATGKRAGRMSFTARNTQRRRSMRGTEERVTPIASPGQTPDVAVSTTAEQASTQVVARMDIQTSDPNIRIIWLARKPSE